MRKNILRKATGYLDGHRRHRMWKKVVIALACVVVFCTTYALILPAITLEEVPQCGKTGHMHTEDCFQTEEDSEPLCGLEEHAHSAACSVIGLIEELPDRQSVDEHMAAFGETDDSYLIETQAQVRKAYDAYLSLPEEETVKVENIDRLTALEWLLGLSFQESAAVTVENEDNGSVDVVPWVDEANEVRRHLQASLFSIDQGYAIENIEYYQITGLTGGSADVTYSSGSGLSSSGAGARVFVYELGADGKKTPQNCAVENQAQDEKTGLFTSFSFEIPEGNEGESRIYAFISVRSATLEDMGIYLGTVQDDGTWVAYDGSSEADASIKATVTLPEGTTAPEGYSLFIRKIYEGENFNPTQEAVRTKAGEVNDWQCYTIRWIMQDETGLHMKPLNAVGTTTVRIEYLKDDARLSGPAGARKLLIFNSNKDGSLVERVADSVENVLVTDDSYTSFTFQAAQTGPYVFVSKKLEMGYIDALNIERVIDGSAPFDKTDTPGNDSSKNNNIVRSYDTIQYDLAATFGARQEGVTANEVDMYFELTLKKSATAAKFDISKMLWMGENYSIEYLDDSGNVIMIMDHNGKYYKPQTDENGNVRRDDHGFALADKSQSVSMNAQVNGSTAGADSYKVTSGGVAMQRLVGWTTLKANEGESILSGTQTFSTAVEVRNADNGEIFAPTFKMWLEGNEDNYGPEGRSGEVMLPATPDEDNVVDVNKPENSMYQVKVSAGTNFNVCIKRNSDMSYKNWFDFSTGDAVAEPVRSELVRLANLEENHGKSNPAEFTDGGKELSEDLKAQYANYRYGRITCYGITLQLYNDTDNSPSEDLASKGLKGFSLPVGDITFDLNFYSKVNSKDESVDPNEYTAILWDYNENVPANTSYSYEYDDPGRGVYKTPNDGKGNGGRNIYWDGEVRSPYAKGGGPSNYIAYHNGCYYGGDWAMVDEDGKKTDINTLANPTVVTGTGEGTTYHFSVSDYDFDFDNQHFPLRDAGNSGNVTGYDTYARCFSAGCVQVLTVFPMVQEVSEAEIMLYSEVSNLQLTTRAGQELKAEEGDETKIGHEANTNDNKVNNQIVLYAPGSLTKGNSFNGKYNNQVPNSTSEGFLGTEYWTTSYDCSTFAGDEIWLVSYGMMISGSDYRTRSMNLLQLFDSRALSICGEPDVVQNWDPAFDKEGDATFLYAADPDYPNGYDTNEKGVLTYMNSVREEDLLYFTSLNELSDAGYTCVGILMELRNCDLLGGKYQYMRIPVKVNGDDENLVTRTVATVNTYRVWSENLGNVSWINGKWNYEDGKNELPELPKPTNSVVNDVYSGELANGGKSPPNYVKTEYSDGLMDGGTHTGGTLSGNSLLILSYKAGINIGVDNKAQSSMISYNLGDGETVVDYRLKNIKTEISNLTGQEMRPLTTLTINAVLDEGHSGTQRISVSGGSYRIMGYAVNADGTIDSEKSNISISSDPNNPTELEFEGQDGVRYRIKVHAQMGAGSQSVKFIIQNAPVGLQLPDITFQANFAAVTALKNNDTIKTSTYISGQGDNRAYDKTKGNTDNITVGVVLGSSTNLTKAVTPKYIELNGVITYDVTYTNSGSDQIKKIYFYDLIPHNDDIRGSDFLGDVILRSVDVTSSTKEKTHTASATVYYSTTDYFELYNTVSVFGGTVDDHGKISGMNEIDVELMLQDEKLFKVLGQVKNGKFEYDSSLEESTNLTELMSTVTGLYAKVENLQKGETINMQIMVETRDNKADDWYKNIANSWIAGSKTLPLTSNKVETQTISRSISGVIWYDKNLNGIRDDGEPLLEGVKVTLFKTGENGDYELCTESVAGEKISPITSGKDGTYSFGKLSEGNYIVAFSGSTLEKFTGATTHQKNGTNDSNTSDGKAVTEEMVDLFESNIDEYAYYIHYSAGSPSIRLHSLEEMETVSLVNGVEQYANQDLGLIIATYELPKTGGTGRTSYIIVGLLLISAAGILLMYRKTRERRIVLTTNKQ